MRVLGVDPGLTRCGVAVVDGQGGRRAGLVHAGVVRTDPGEDVARRLVTVHAAVVALLDEHRPDVVAVERVFAQHNVRSVMGTAQSAGVVMLAASQVGLAVATHTPSEVKAAVTGNGRADKAQVGLMVARILGLAAAPRPADAADAVALALCQLWRGTADVRRRAAADAAPRSRYAELVRQGASSRRASP
ncbi:crossover junction endodeoxyribonuclease RuvC [Aquipuribacter nitratireducens]|uniref:Crossover junction endodeoxyribonuclease RuvC n=1 Tax=Aquipuribacter nitratireducens TaxID=650104 RepID=A0ABW0GS60_9MICO